jgi:precorrin-6A synthase
VGRSAFYDSTIRVVDAIGERLPIVTHVVPGISAFQALAAAHSIVLHAVGQPIHITTGRRLVDEWSPSLGSVVVMLDGHLACQGLVERAPDLLIHWGAYLGLPQQTLRSVAWPTSSTTWSPSAPSCVPSTDGSWTSTS